MRRNNSQVSEWFEKSFPKLLCLNIECKSQELDGMLWKIQSRRMIFISRFGSQFALQ